MKAIPYVDEASAAIAHVWQERIQSLPPDTGILFVSVTGVGIEGGKCKQFDVVLGVKKSIAIGTVMAVIKHYFEEELERYGVTLTIYQGVEGSARSESHPGPGQHPARKDDSV